MKELFWIVLNYLLACIFVPPFLARRKSNTLAEAAPLLDTRGASERVLCIDDNEQALVWRLRLIAAAQERIILSVFDFWTDQSGRDILSALLAASERGVSVQILVDRINGDVHLRSSRYFQALASHDNVSIKFYNPLHFWNYWAINYRLHDKYLIVDDRMYLLGGRNIHDGFLGNYAEKRSVDRDILVFEENPDTLSSLDSLEAYFNGVWNKTCCKPISVGKNHLLMDKAAEELRERYADLSERFDLFPDEHGWYGSTVEAKQISLLTNPTGTWNKEPKLWEHLLDRMRSARDVVIQTPYIICDSAMVRELKALCAGGTNVRLLTNAPQNGANPFGCADLLSEKNRILRTGVELFEYAGGNSLHTKTLLLDGTTCIVGSFNMDMRSTYLDTETMLAIDSPALATQLGKVVAQAETASLHTGKDGKPTKGPAYLAKPLNLLKRAFFAVLRVISRPFRYLM